MGAGLGGGSSDAATTLHALNVLWDTRFSVDELAEMGLTLGADVPVFIHGFAAFAEGIGEKLSPLSLAENWYLVVVPPVHVATKEIFLNPELTRDSTRITIRAFVAGDSRNDCLPVVRKRYPQVAQAIDWLGEFADARLTGTGACVFAAFDSEEAAQRVAARLPAGLEGFVARGMNRSPLMDRLANEAPGG